MGINDGSISPMKDPRGYLTDEEIERIFKACTNIKDYLVIRTLARTGIRVTELIMIRPADLLPNENQIIITQLKKRGESYRNVYIDKVTMDTLIQYVRLKKIEPDERIFNITRFAIFAIVRKVGKLANINQVGKSKIHPHNFRHSYAIKAIRSGVDIRKLQLLLGHSSYSTTAAYLQYGSKELRDEYDKMFS